MLPGKVDNRMNLSFQPSSVKCMKFEKDFYNLSLESETNRNKITM